MKDSRRSFFGKLLYTTAGALIMSQLPGKVNANPSSLNSEDESEAYWKEIRKEFPLTPYRTYFNNGTYGPSPLRVMNEVQSTIYHINAQGENRGYEKVRATIADFINAKKAEISLTHNVTEGINVIAHGLPLKAGDEVIMTTHEHVGNAVPWLNRMHLHNIVIKTFKPRLTADGNMNAINDLITDRTRVIAVPHISCTTGQVFPVKEISTLGKDKNIWTFIDGAHAPGSTVVDVKDIGCDFYASCFHKWLCGPKGTGFLYLKEELLDTVQALFIGGYSDKGWDLEPDSIEFKGYQPSAHRYDYATQNSALYLGAKSAVEFMEEIGIDKIEKRTRYLSTYLHNKLLEMPDKVEIISPMEDKSRGPMVGIVAKNKTMVEFNRMCSSHRFRVRIVREAGLNSIRISTHIYNNPTQIDRFIEMIGNYG